MLPRHSVFIVERLVVADVALQVEIAGCILQVLGIRDRRLAIDLVAFAGFLALLYVDESPVDEIRFHNMLGNLQHELAVLVMPCMQDPGDPHYVFTVRLHSYIRSMVSLVIALFITCSVGAGVDLLLRDMSLDLRDFDCIWPFCSGSFFEVVPEIAVWNSFPVGLALLTLASESPKNTGGPVQEGFAVRPYVDRAVGDNGDDGSGEFSPGGTATVPPYGGIKHESALELPCMSEFLSAVRSLWKIAGFLPGHHTPAPPSPRYCCSGLIQLPSV